ncbi:hypothetical protein [Deinococcus taeanensis]|nr:hypothetical protein [Deinococcus taeanensis]
MTNITDARTAPAQGAFVSTHRSDFADSTLAASAFGLSTLH